MTTHKHTINPWQGASMTTSLVLKAVWCCFLPCFFFLKKKTEKKRKHRVKKQYQVNRIKNTHTHTHIYIYSLYFEYIFLFYPLRSTYQHTMAPFVCWKVIFFWKVNSGKVNYFPMFCSVMKNKLENIFQCLVMSWKMSWKITY
jgi:hypothetical protein